MPEEKKKVVKSVAKKFWKIAGPNWAKSTFIS